MNDLDKINTSKLATKNPAELVKLIADVYDKNGLSAELELQFIQFRINEDYRLQKAAKTNPASLFHAILQASECGLSLNPQWQEGYLVPYKQKVDNSEIDVITFSPMYRGKKKLLIQKNIVKNIVAMLVYENEHFEEEIIDGIHKITHKPNSFKRSDPTKIIGGYAVITYNNDTIQNVVKGKDYFERCKKASYDKMKGKTSPAWRLWYDEMCLKCLINAADSVIPKIGVNHSTAKLLTDVNNSDIDYVDVTEKQKEIPPKKEAINDSQLSILTQYLFDYKISLDAALKKAKAKYTLTTEQIEKIKEAGTITDAKLAEIVEMIIAGEKTIADFNFILNKEQLEVVKTGVTDALDTAE